MTENGWTCSMCRKHWPARPPIPEDAIGCPECGVHVPEDAPVVRPRPTADDETITELVAGGIKVSLGSTANGVFPSLELGFIAWGGGPSFSVDNMDPCDLGALIAGMRWWYERWHGPLPEPDVEKPS